MSGHPAVPEHLTGAWRRTLVTTPAGYRDADTRAIWVQTRGWCCDLRVPANRPTHGAQTFAAYSDDELVALADARGFAGWTSAGAGLCAWRREHDFQPPPPAPDESSYAFDGQTLIERGLAGEFEEQWRLEPGSRGALLAFGLAGPVGGLLVIAGDHFQAVISRDSPGPQSGSLRQCVHDALVAGDRGEAERLLNMEISYGRISGGGSPWRITLSTLPWREGASFWRSPVQASADVLSLSETGPHGARHWTRLDSSVDAAEVARALRLPAISPMESRDGR